MITDSISPGAIKSEDEHRRDICAVGRLIHARAFIASTDGNISVRLDSRRILTSPTGMSKGMMVPDDLVITDFLMPGIDGLELARLIKAGTPQRPVLLITAHEETVSRREKARLQHVDAMLTKPFSHEQLLDALRAVFR